MHGAQLITFLGSFPLLAAGMLAPQIRAALAPIRLRRARRQELGQ